MPGPVGASEHPEADAPTLSLASFSTRIMRRSSRRRLRSWTVRGAVDSLLLRAELKARGIWDEVGGRDNVASIVMSVPGTGAMGEHYAGIVKEKAMRRDTAQKVARDIAGRLAKPRTDETAATVIQGAIGELWNIAQRRSGMKSFSLAEIMANVLARKREGRMPALLTGIDSLDQFPGIFGFGKYTIVGGRPGMAKHIRPLAVAALVNGRHALRARGGGRGPREDGGNYLSSFSEIENARIAYGHLHSDEMERLDAIVQEHAETPLFGFDEAFTLAEVGSAVERLVTDHKCQVVAVDHIHLITPDRRSENGQAK